MEEQLTMVSSLTFCASASIAAVVLQLLTLC
jgi:hypothetical protein